MAVIEGIILRSKNRRRVAQFYAALGIVGNEHAHGGPVHTELPVCAAEPVVEIYVASNRFGEDALMIKTDSLDQALAVAASFNCPIVTPVKEIGDARFVYLRDPDGRLVMLRESARD